MSHPSSCLDDTQVSAFISKSPIGPFSVVVSEKGLVRVAIGIKLEGVQGQCSSSQAVLDQAVSELEEYLHGERRIFHVPVDWSPFQGFRLQALQQTAQIPYGEVRTYGQMAALIGRPKAARAFGGMMASNPVPLVIPCHRVVGEDRRLHGFSAPDGIATKAFLLQMEGVCLVDQKLA